MTRSLTITLNAGILKAAVAIGLVLAGLVIGMGVSAAQAEAAVEDTAYTAIEPCASFDSRTDTGALADKYTTGESRTFQITGTAPTNQQAGIDCGIPTGANAVLINIVAIQPETGGNLRAYATGDTGTGGVVNYSPQTPNLNNSNAVVIPLSALGQLDIENNCGGCPGNAVHARGVLLGYFTDNLATQVQQLFVAFDPDGDGILNVTSPDATTIRFESANVQIVDGTGDTQCTGDDLNGGTTGTGEDCNGLGNLLIGYNEDTAMGGTETRSGTHSLIIGTDQSWTGYSHLIAGSRNTVTASYSSIVGGLLNTTEGAHSTIGGGSNNTATATASVVSGGDGNRTFGPLSTIAGGRSNVTFGVAGAVSGGIDNIANGDNTAVAGGSTNIATGEESVIIGGDANSTTGEKSVVVGGGSGGGVFDANSNVASGELSVVVGGGGNEASADRSAVSGGSGNTASGLASVVSGGALRTSNGTFDWRAGGLFEDQ